MEEQLLVAFTFLLEKTSNELFDVRSGEKINSVSVVILVSCDKVIKTESGNRHVLLDFPDILRK